MTVKQKFPLRTARAVAEKIVASLAPFCRRITIAGSIRREKTEVGDIEILYIPKIETVETPDPNDMFGAKQQRSLNLADVQLQGLINGGQIQKRLNKLGRESWGQDNKFARAVKTGVPIDFFSTNEIAWYNYLVCRTGPADLNTEIAARAKRMGYTWHPTAYGFERRFESEPGKVRWLQVTSEQQVFDFVGLPYLDPTARRWPL